VEADVTLGGGFGEEKFPRLVRGRLTVFGGGASSSEEEETLVPRGLEDALERFLGAIGADEGGAEENRLRKVRERKRENEPGSNPRVGPALKRVELRWLRVDPGKTVGRPWKRNRTLHRIVCSGICEGRPWESEGRP